jgi:predicted peptidase
MQKRRFVLASMAIIAGTLGATAQSGQPSARFGFGPLPPSEELAVRPQTPGAKGDQQRHYHFAAAGREMPYHLFVPQSYDPAAGAPLVVALHGFGGNQDYFFAQVKELPALCEKYGFIFVAPMGLAHDGWYGAPLSIPGSAPRSSGAPPPPQLRTPEEETKYRALSEADVMNVLDIVRKEYKVDPNRIYLIGHSMGGFGTWWLGQKYADTWAAIAPMSGVLPDVDYQILKLTQVPVQISIGGAETPAWVEASRKLAETMKAKGMTVAYVEPDGATHSGMIAPTTPQALEFFAKHVRRPAKQRER